MRTRITGNQSTSPLRLEMYKKATLANTIEIPTDGELDHQAV